MTLPNAIRLAVLALLFPFCLPAQQVWPGDANNNGIVNAVDVLYVGLAYDAEGPERPSANTDFTPQAFDLWPQDFPNGINYGYADADGDGKIEDDDIEFGIRPNFGETHGTLQPDGYQNAAAGSGAPQATLTPSATLVQPGATVDITLSLGSSSQPIEDFYGVAFAFSYNNELLESDGMGISYDEPDMPWYATDPEDEAEELFVNQLDDSRAELAVTRTDQMSISGNGEVAVFSIFIEDIIVGLEVDTFHFGIDSILLIDQSFKTTAVIPDEVAIIVAADTNLVNEAQAVERLPVRLFPNPAKESAMLRCPYALQQVELIDARGRVCWRTQEVLARTPLRIPLKGLAPGLYIVRGRHERQAFARKLWVHR